MYPSKAFSNLYMKNFINAFNSACDEEDAQDWRPSDGRKENSNSNDTTDNTEKLNDLISRVHLI